MFDYLAVGMMRNLLPWYAKTLGGGAVLLGTLETAYGVGQVVGASFLGRLSDVHGRRLVVFISGLGSALGYGMSAGATTATMLIASRIPVGLAKQTVTVSRAILADCTPVEKRTGIMTQSVHHERQTMNFKPSLVLHHHQWHPALGFCMGVLKYTALGYCMGVLKYTGGQQRLNPPPAPQRNGAA